MVMMLCCLGCSGANASLIFVDDFTADAAGWALTGSSSSINHDAVNGEMDFTTTSTFRGAYVNFTSTTLSQVGDTISFSADVRLNESINADLGFGVVIGNSAGDAYFFGTNTGDGNPTPYSSSVFDANNFGGSASGNLTPGGTPSILLTSGIYTPLYGSITRLSDPSKLGLTWKVGGTTYIDSVTVSDHEGTTELVYDRISIVARAAAVDFSVDNVKIEYTAAVPEPSSTLALLGLIFSSLVSYRRRRVLTPRA